jgi:hypothetical protein
MPIHLEMLYCSSLSSCAFHAKLSWKIVLLITIEQLRLPCLLYCGIMPIFIAATCQLSLKDYTAPHHWAVATSMLTYLERSYCSSLSSCGFHANFIWKDYTAHHWAVAASMPTHLELLYCSMSSCGFHADLSWKTILFIIEQLRLQCRLIVKDYTAHHWVVAASMPTFWFSLRHHAHLIAASCRLIFNAASLPTYLYTPVGSCCLEKQYETKTCIFDIAASLPTCGAMPRSHSCGILPLIASWAVNLWRNATGIILLIIEQFFRHYCWLVAQCHVPTPVGSCCSFLKKLLSSRMTWGIIAVLINIVALLSLPTLLWYYAALEAVWDQTCLVHGIIAMLFCCCGDFANLLYFAPQAKLLLINCCGVITAHSRSQVLATPLSSYNIILVHLLSSACGSFTLSPASLPFICALGACHT